MQNDLGTHYYSEKRPQRLWCPLPNWGASSVDRNPATAVVRLSPVVACAGGPRCEGAGLRIGAYRTHRR